MGNPRVYRAWLTVLSLAVMCLPVLAQEDKPNGAAAKPDASRLPHVKVDVKNKQVRVECEAINAQMPLEFFCVLSGTAEHESVLRTDAKPSHIHLGLLMLGQQPGEPVKYSESAKKWIPPQGPPVHITCEWQGKDGQPVRVPAYRMMRNVKTKKVMEALTWVFCGSRMMEDNRYAADTTGYVVSVVNFDLTLIDVPKLASDANDTLEWEFNPDVCPERGTKVWMILEPAGKDTAPQQKENGAKRKENARSGGEENPLAGEAASAAGNAVSTASDPQRSPRLSDVQIDEQRVKALREKWEKAVKPHNQALREAAQAHYEVVNALRAEQNRLIDEADRIQRVIDQIQKDYQDMTTPRPEQPEQGDKSDKSANRE
jgi:hypothetical protein